MHFLKNSSIIVLGILGVISVLTLYSASGGSFSPWATNQMIGFFIGFLLLFLISKVSTEFFYDYAYFFYIAAFILIVVAMIAGHVGMGARRWINLYVFHLQPSEFMRLALIVTLARYFSDHNDVITKTRYLITPILLVGVPLIVILKQPDLGTALLILATSAIIGFASGIQWWKFLVALISFGASFPIFWQFLHDYQKQRILIFLNPEMDPRSKGYHILQSKIAIGSGGIWGTGYLQGTQSHLYFLPEKHTDFVFTMFFEEWGLVASTLLIGLYIYLIGYGYHIALHTRRRFEQLLAIGLTSSLFLYVFVNIAMVLGLVPVVGIPLPYMSYGRTALLSLMISHGMLMSVMQSGKKTKHFHNI